MHVKCSRLWVPGIVWWDFKGIVHPKMKILSSFTVVLNLYEFLCSPQLKRRYLKNVITRMFLVPIDSNSVFIFLFFFFHTMKVMQQLFGYQYCSQYIILRSTAEGNSYRLRKTTDFFFFFWWTIRRKQPNIAAVAICVNNVNQTSERKSLHVLDWITFVK